MKFTLIVYSDSKEEAIEDMDRLVNAGFKTGTKILSCE